MTLDELLKQGFSFLDQVQKAVIPDNIDPNAAGFHDEYRKRRIANLKANIDALSQRRDNAVRAYDQAIAAEQAELESLSRQAPMVAPKAADPAKTPMRKAPKPSGKRR